MTRLILFCLFSFHNVSVPSHWQLPLLSHIHWFLLQAGKLSGPPPNYPHKLQENTPFTLPHFHHNVPPCHREELTRSRSPIVPLRESTNCQLSETLSNSVSCSLMRTASLTSLSPSVSYLAVCLLCQFGILQLVFQMMSP